MSFRPGIADSVAGLLIALLLCCLAENKKRLGDTPASRTHPFGLLLSSLTESQPCAALKSAAVAALR